MINVPIGFGPVPDAVSFSAVFVGVEYTLAAWLAVAVIGYGLLLALGTRRDEREGVDVTGGAVALRKAA